MIQRLNTEICHRATDPFSSGHWMEPRGIQSTFAPYNFTIEVLLRRNNALILEITPVCIGEDSVEYDLLYHGLGGGNIDHISIRLHLGCWSTSNKRELIDLKTVKHNPSCNGSVDSILQECQDDCRNPQEEDVVFPLSYMCRVVVLEKPSFGIQFVRGLGSNPLGTGNTSLPSQWQKSVARKHKLVVLEGISIRYTCIR